jgi:hypothetical protein
MCLQPGVSRLTLEHELVHVRQVEDLLLLSAILSIVVVLVEGNPWWTLLWPSGVVWLLPNFLGAALRKGHIYRDAEHERGAYAQTDAHHTKDEKSWLDIHLSKPRDW